MVYQNLDEIKKTLDVFSRENGLFEIRSFDGERASGYFKTLENVENLAACVQNSRDTLYFVLNEIHEDCYARTQREKLVKYAKIMTADGNIIRRNWILIDCDPNREISGTNATAEEKEYARKTAQKIYKWLEEQGFEKPVVADSGNGYHLLYKIRLENSDENRDLIANFLKVLDLYFSDDKASIDTSVYNASRITKLYGTLVQKGADAPERPQRYSKILSVPEKINLTGDYYIKRVADMLPKPEQTEYKVYSGGILRQSSKFELREFIAKHGIRVKQEIQSSEGTKYILEQCPYNAEHRKKDAMLFEGKDGRLGFICLHNSCSDKHWQDFRLLYEPDAYDDKSKSNGYKQVNDAPLPNYRNKSYKPVDFAEIEANAPKTADNTPEPKFYTTEMIRNEPNIPEEFIETGISAIDRKMRGLCKGEITCLSGETGSGKSSLVSQLVLEAAQRGYRTALFSGELKRKRAYKWLVFQAAGKKHVRPTQFENYYIVGEECEEPISKWLNEQVYIYNNSYGNNFEYIKEQLGQIVSEKRLDLIILDNLMSMDIDSLGDEKNNQQTVFVKRLKSFAEQNNVHVLFVAHPRKTNGERLIDKGDVCGSSNIMNHVDNLFIIYRVTARYKLLKSKEFKCDAGELENAGNELRICKDREGGELDTFIPFYFERESKRLKNSAEEIKFYGWSEEETKNQFNPITDEELEDLPIEWQ